MCGRGGRSGRGATWQTSGHRTEGKHGAPLTAMRRASREKTGPKALPLCRAKREGQRPVPDGAGEGAPAGARQGQRPTGPKSCGWPDGRWRMCRLAILGGETTKQGHERAEAQEDTTRGPPHDRDASGPNGRAAEWRGRARGPRPRRREKVGGVQGRKGGRSARQGGASAVGRGHAGRAPVGSRGPLDDRAT